MRFAWLISTLALFAALLLVPRGAEAQTAAGSKLISALGTCTVSDCPAMNVIVEFVKSMVAPVLGIPVAVKLALNQI